MDTKKTHTKDRDVAVSSKLYVYLLPCVWAGHRFCQRLGAAERMQLFNSGDSSHGEDHSGQAALGPVHRNTSRLHSHSKSEFSRKTQTKHFVFCFLRRDVSGRSVSGVSWLHPEVPPELRSCLAFLKHSSTKAHWTIMLHHVGFTNPQTPWQKELVLGEIVHFIIFDSLCPF